jgi:hypothetical protein
MVAEPRVRHRGFFFHSDTETTDTEAEVDSAEGLTARVRVSHASSSRRTGGRFGGRSSSELRLVHEGRPEIRSGSVTGSRQRAHSHR